MPYRFLTLVVVILLIPKPIDAAAFESASIFGPEECEKYLTGRPGKALMGRVKHWLNHLPTVSLLTPRRVEKTPFAAAEPEPELVNPKLIWFTNHPGATFEEVLQRYEEALERSDQYHLNMVRSLPSPTHEQVQAEVDRSKTRQRLIDQYPLDAMEMAAFGIPGQEPLMFEGMHARLISDNDKILRLEFRRDDEILGDVNLPHNTLRTGWRNVIPDWQAARLDDDQVPPPQPAKVKANARRKLLQEFLREQGQFALFRQNGDYLFAYTFGMVNLESSAAHVKGVAIEIYLAKPCSNEEMAATEFSFPPLTPDQDPLCFSDTFLKLQVPVSRPTTMDVRQPVGLSERKYEL